MVIVGNNCQNPRSKKTRKSSEIKGESQRRAAFRQFSRRHPRWKKIEFGNLRKGVKSHPAFCHLGNIAWRTGRTINLDPKTHKISDDHAAMKLWSREYRRGWEPKV